MNACLIACLATGVLPFIVTVHQSSKGFIKDGIFAPLAGMKLQEQD